MKIMRGRKMKIGIGNDHVAVEMKNYGVVDAHKVHCPAAQIHEEH